jgi:uncharacterized membrane protein
MPVKKSENDDDIEARKSPFSASQLVISLLFGTYFLTVQTIELSLSIYVLQQNKLELYKEYLIFKNGASIWKWWHLFSSLTIPLSIFGAFQGLFQIFTKKATKKRNLIDIIAALQLFTVLSIVFTRILPIENQLIETISKEYLYELNSFQWIVFLLNILGWFIPIVRYQDRKNDQQIDSKKKIQ